MSTKKELYEVAIQLSYNSDEFGYSLIKSPGILIIPVYGRNCRAPKKVRLDLTASSRKYRRNDHAIHISHVLQRLPESLSGFVRFRGRS